MPHARVAHKVGIGGSPEADGICAGGNSRHGIALLECIAEVDQGHYTAGDIGIAGQGGIMSNITCQAQTGSRDRQRLAALDCLQQAKSIGNNGKAVHDFSLDGVIMQGGAEGDDLVTILVKIAVKQVVRGQAAIFESLENFLRIRRRSAIDRINSGQNEGAISIWRVGDFDCVAINGVGNRIALKNPIAWIVVPSLGSCGAAGLVASGQSKLTRLPGKLGCYIAAETRCQTPVAGAGITGEDFRGTIDILERAGNDLAIRVYLDDIVPSKCFIDCGFRRPVPLNYGCNC